MGYTHYWTLKKEANDPVRFKKAVELFKELWAAAPKTITGEGWDKKTQSWKPKRFRKEKLLKNWDGKGEPTISETEICFNGDDKYGLDHETFRISLNQFDEEHAWMRNDNGDIWDFCKTARKPYDLAVCLTLLSFKEIFGDDFEFSSDGITRESIKVKANLDYWDSIGYVPEIEDEWKKAYKVFDKVLAEHYAVSTMAR